MYHFPWSFRCLSTVSILPREWQLISTKENLWDLIDLISPVVSSKKNFPCYIILIKSWCKKYHLSSLSCMADLIRLNETSVTKNIIADSVKEYYRVEFHCLVYLSTNEAVRCVEVTNAYKLVTRGCKKSSMLELLHLFNGKSCWQTTLPRFFNVTINSDECFFQCRFLMTSYPEECFGIYLDPFLLEEK